MLPRKRGDLKKFLRGSPDLNSWTVALPRPAAFISVLDGGADPMSLSHQSSLIRAAATFSESIRYVPLETRSLSS